MYEKCKTLTLSPMKTLRVLPPREERCCLTLLKACYGSFQETGVFSFWKNTKDLIHSWKTFLLKNLFISKQNNYWKHTQEPFQSNWSQKPGLSTGLQSTHKEQMKRTHTCSGSWRPSWIWGHQDWGHLQKYFPAHTSESEAQKRTCLRKKQSCHSVSPQPKEGGVEGPADPALLSGCWSRARILVELAWVTRTVQKFTTMSWKSVLRAPNHPPISTRGTQL